MPKRSVGTISPTVAALAATGSSATSGTRRAPRPSCASRTAGSARASPASGPTPRPAEHGDLLDVIRETLGLTRFRDVADEARRFLNLPRPSPEKSISPRNAPARASSSAKRLLALCRPIDGTLAQTYLRRRGVTAFGGTESPPFPPLLLLPRGRELADRRSGRHSLPPSPTCRTGSPASIALGSTLSSAVADHGKAPIENPRRSLGDIWTHAVRFGVAQDVMAAGEGIETILSLRSVLPALPMIAALSASNLAAVVFPATLAPTLRRHGRRSRRRARGGSACRPSRRGRDRGHRSSPGEERLQR